MTESPFKEVPQPDDLLPDSRTRWKHRHLVSGPLGLMERVYCANCGGDGGLVTAEWAYHVFYLCDGCVEKHGYLPLAEIPEAAVRGKASVLDGGRTL